MKSISYLAIAMFASLSAWGCTAIESDEADIPVKTAASVVEQQTGQDATQPTIEPESTTESEQTTASNTETKAMTERAVLAGGCFWGMQDLFRKLPGVIETRVGYTGGEVKFATYRNHGNHAEAIEVIFDPAKTNFRNMLEFFFQVHDPTTKNRQGNDIGASYRSAIYYTSDEQKLVALDTIEDVNASGLWPGKVVTEVEPASDFWEAEPEHQDYLERIPNGYTCHFARPDWVLPKRDKSANEKSAE
ncbi:MAG: peptide-methionine (S)-S-oxide reductase MsrA [Fuerstiella sp.]